jgi:hypothetical protein
MSICNFERHAEPGLGIGLSHSPGWWQLELRLWRWHLELGYGVDFSRRVARLRRRTCGG